MAELTVAALQLPLNGEEAENIAAVGELISEAAQNGAQIILPPELFAGPYFCKTKDDANFALAASVAKSKPVSAMQKLAKQLRVAIPTSFFERERDDYYNSIAMIDPNGDIMGIYRKSHIPDGPGYEEKHYFRPGDTGFKTWDVFGTTIGVGICWDQWFPECARAMALMGAEILLYPTAIGSEPHDSDIDTSRMWRRAMQGHAVCNSVPLIAANRVGDEDGQTFYGQSFIANEWGDLVAEFDATESGVLIERIDMEMVAKNRRWMALFADRRPDIYGRLVGDRSYGDIA